jgi:hypothetical protein
MIEDISDEDWEARQRLFMVKEQIDSAHAGKFDIACPYCQAFNTPGKEFCCDLLRKAVITILMGRRQGMIEAAGKYGDN